MVKPAADSAARERFGVGAALRRRVAAADDREGRAREKLAPAEAVEAPAADRRFRAARAG